MKYINSEKICENDVNERASKEEFPFDFNAQLYNKFIKAVANKEQISTECKNVYSVIDDIVFGKAEDQFIKTIHCGTILYRARIVNPDCGYDKKGICRREDDSYSGFDEFNSREPLVGISASGRNNYEGVSYFYAASDPETACMEVKPVFSDLISLAEFKVKRELRIVDFLSEKSFTREISEDCKMSLGIFFTRLMFRYMEPVDKKDDYYATQIISDYIRKTGIDGIAYGSFLTPEGTNYTIFNSHPQNIEFIGSKLVTCRQADYCFWDLNTNNEIHSNINHKGMDFDAEDMKAVKKNLNTLINVGI